MNQARSETIGYARDVGYSYGETVAVAGLDLEIRRGEVLALLGPNGAGKTTTISLLLGQLPADVGAVSLFGGNPNDEPVRQRRGAMLQISGIPGTLTVREHLELYRRYYPRPLSLERLLAAAGLAGLEDRRYDRLSGGQQQRVMFALALAGDPDLVFLDEPTTGLDVEARRILWREIRALKDAGRTVLLTTHYLDEADALADRVVVIDHGHVVAEGSPAEIKRRTASRKIRCITTVAGERIAALPEVARVDSSGHHSVILSSEPEAVLRTLLELDPELSDLEVGGAGLEEAFLSLTRDDQEAA